MGNNYFFYFFLTESKGEASVNYSKCNLFSIEKTHKRPFFSEGGSHNHKTNPNFVLKCTDVQIFSFKLISDYFET